MSDRPDRMNPDPLGLEKLGAAIADAALPPEFSGIEDAYQQVKSRYTALQDRYRLLKASNRQLAEEVAWLRDQCDDFVLEAEPDAEGTQAGSEGLR